MHPGKATMRNRIGHYLGRPTDVDRAKTMLSFCDAVWQLHIDPNGLQQWEIESLSRLDREAATILRAARLGLGRAASRHCQK
jgi:hypothetical protein